MKAENFLLRCSLILFFSIAFIAIGFWKAPETHAASLSFAPSSESYSVRKSFTVGIKVSSADQALNAVSAVIAYPADLLKIKSISKKGSIISLWAQEPSFSNKKGEITLEGIVLNPGFKGTNGRVLTVTFETKAAGRAMLNFVTALVLANDGEGTNILKEIGSASFEIGQANQSSPAKSQSPAPLPAPSENVAPIIISPTHPDSNQWFARSQVIFEWQLPKNVKAISLALDAQPDTLPVANKLLGLIRKKVYKNVADGAWYFHLRFRTSDGWGPAAHYRVQIDTQPPQPISLRFPLGKINEAPRPIVLIAARDATSGISHYQIKINDSQFQRLPADPHGNEYVFPPQEPGKKIVVAQAFDQADNVTAITDEITVTPLVAPTITAYPHAVRGNRPLEIAGQSYPNATIWLTVENSQGEGVTHKQLSLASGEFYFRLANRLLDGAYNISARVQNARGATSLDSDPVAVKVISTPDRSRFPDIRSGLVLLGGFILGVAAKWLLDHLNSRAFRHRRNRFKRRSRS